MSKPCGCFISGPRFDNNGMECPQTEWNCRIPSQDFFDHRVEVWYFWPVGETRQSFETGAKHLTEFSPCPRLDTRVQSHRQHKRREGGRDLECPTSTTEALTLIKNHTVSIPPADCQCIHKSRR